MRDSRGYISIYFFLYVVINHLPYRSFVVVDLPRTSYILHIHFLTVASIGSRKGRQTTFRTFMIINCSCSSSKI